MTQQVWSTVFPVAVMYLILMLGMVRRSVFRRHITPDTEGVQRRPRIITALDMTLTTLVLDLSALQQIFPFEFALGGRLSILVVLLLFVIHLQLHIYLLGRHYSRKNLDLQEHPMAGLPLSTELLVGMFALMSNAMTVFQLIG